MERRIVSILSDLVSINSVNTTLSGGPGEKDVVEFIQAYLSRTGFDPQAPRVAGERANVVALVHGKKPGPALLLNGHIDTVGIEGMPSPFTLRQEGDRLYGRGTYDMKGSVAVMLALAGFWAQHPPERDVWLTFSCDEEDRSLGTEFLVHWLPTLPSLPGGAIFLEPTEENIGVAHKGFTWFEVEVHGKAAHGSRPERASTPFCRYAQRWMSSNVSDPTALRPPDALLGHASLHAGKIEGGTELSVVPAHARLQWERRTLPDEDAGEVDAELGRVARALQQLRGPMGLKAERSSPGRPTRPRPQPRSSPGCATPCPEHPSPVFPSGRTRRSWGSRESPASSSARWATAPTPWTSG